MKIKLIKKTSLAIAVSLTMIAGAVNAVENKEQANATNDALISKTTLKELSLFEEFLIILGLEKGKGGAVSLNSTGDECDTDKCAGRVKR